MAGVDIQVTDVDYPGDDRRGLVAACERAGEQHTVTLLDIVPSPTIAAGVRQLIDAYRRWAGAEPLPPHTSCPVGRD